jgi:hypothetical protein
MTNRRAADDVVDDLLQYDDVLQSRIETLLGLVAREAALRENAEFYKHRSSHHQQGYRRSSTGSGIDHTTASSVTGSSFDTARLEMTSMFRKLHRRLAASSLDAATGAESQTTSDEADAQRLPFAISNLSSLLRTGSVMTSVATRANLRDMLRNPHVADSDETEAAVRDRTRIAEDALESRRQEFMSMLCGDCERVADAGARAFRERCTTRVPSFGVCGCDSCLQTWRRGLVSLTPCSWARVPSLRDNVLSGVRQTLALQLVAARRSAIDTDLVSQQLEFRRQSLLVALSSQRALNAIRSSISSTHVRHVGASGSLLRLRDAAVAQAEAQSVCESIREGTSRALLAAEAAALLQERL